MILPEQEENIMTCSWGVNRNELHYCDYIQFIVAYICDKCGGKGTVKLCAYHQAAWDTEYREQEIRCKCGGTYSYKARNIHTGEEEWVLTTINL